MVGLLFILALACAAVPWLAHRLKSRVIAIGLGAGIVLSVLGIVLSVSPYPWTDLVVLLVALTGGLLLARGLPARFWPFFLLLLALSILDVIQILLTANVSPPGAQKGSGPGALLYGNFLLLLPWGRFNVGIFDLLLITAIGEHIRRTYGSLLISLASGSVGVILAAIFVLVTGIGDLPLIPFLTAGWLCCEAAQRARSSHARQQAAEGEMADKSG